MKILMVSFVLTHPAEVGNSQRIYRECVQMKRKGWQIDFLYLGNNCGRQMELTRDYFGEEHFFQCFVGQRSIKARAKDLVRSKMDKKGITRYVGLKYATDELYVDGIDEKINELNDRNSYNVIWFQYFFYSKALEGIEDNSILKVIDTHDRWADRNRIFQKNGVTPVGYYTTKRGERKALKRADVVIAIQKREGKYFEKLLKGTDTKVITMGDLVEQRYTLNRNNGLCYGFIGTSYKPNVMGLKWFCEEVLPLVREECPDSCLVIAGTVCNSVPDMSGVIKMGRVDNLEEFYSKIDFAINPVMSGTGLNIKTIEALSYRKPLVSTQVGAKGIDSNEQVLIECSNKQTFAEAIIRLLTKWQECDRLAQNACKYIEQYNAKNLETLYSIEELLDCKRSGCM